MNISDTREEDAMIALYADQFAKVLADALDEAGPEGVLAVGDKWAADMIRNNPELKKYIEEAVKRYKHQLTMFLQQRRRDRVCGNSTEQQESDDGQG